jgi:hypothetical protein
MKKILISLFVLTLFSCKQEEMEENFNFNAGLEFSVVNAQNEDLLDPEHPNHLDEADIKLFYVIDGEPKEVFDSNLDHPRNIRIFKHANEYRIGLTLNHTKTSDKPVTYIQWNENDTDTIEVVFKQTKNSTIQDSIWVNGEFVWELEDNTVDPFFVLTK